MVAIIDLIDPIPQGFFGLSGDLRSGHNTYFYETDGKVLKPILLDGILERV